MNNGYIVKGHPAVMSPVHEAIAINEDVPVKGDLWKCACDEILTVSEVFPIRTTEYKSRCLETTKKLLDERRTTG